jgi:hypothetical protein
MVVTNQLVSINFQGMVFPYPTTWDLTPTYPNGALDPTHIEVRSKSTGQSWTLWGPVTAFDISTNIATFTLPGSTVEQVEFRRSTPRYSVYRDPLAVSSRVSQANLQANADQGLYTAIEWAAQFGIDAQQVLLPDPKTVPNTLGLQQQTQNYWIDADYSTRVWNFTFAGGYIDRSHVKAQVLLAAGWTPITIAVDDGSAGFTCELREDDSFELREDGGVEMDESVFDENANYPFRFIGPFQLYMDFSVLGEVPKALIIYRHTPRNVKVSSPADAARITAGGMDPSARHALFVAVELGEQLSQYAPPCDCLTSDQVEVEFRSTTDSLQYLTQYQAYQDNFIPDINGHIKHVPVIAIGGTFDPANKGSAITLSEGNLHASITGTGPGAVLTTATWYGPADDKSSVVEFRIVSGTGAKFYIGGKLIEYPGYPSFTPDANMIGNAGVVGYKNNGVAFANAGTGAVPHTYTEYGPYITLQSGDVLGVLAYVGLYFFINGVPVTGLPFLRAGPDGIRTYPMFARSE